MIGIPNLFNLLSKGAVSPIFPVVGLRVNTHSIPSSCPLLTSFISRANSCLVLFVKPVLPTFDSIPIYFRFAAHGPTPEISSCRASIHVSHAAINSASLPDVCAIGAPITTSIVPGYFKNELRGQNSPLLSATGTMSISNSFAMRAPPSL